jgi:hypothetical protein
MVDVNKTPSEMVNKTVVEIVKKAAEHVSHGAVSPTTMFDFTHALHIDENAIHSAQLRAVATFDCYHRDLYQFDYHAWHMVALWLIGSMI